MASIYASFLLTGSTDETVPPDFFREIGFARFCDLMAHRDGMTNAQETRRIWRLMKRTDKAPKSIRLVFNTGQVLRHAPPEPTGSIASALDALWQRIIEN